jgi:hypothetical protein
MKEVLVCWKSFVSWPSLWLHESVHVLKSWNCTLTPSKAHFTMWSFFFSFSFINHMCIQGLVHFSPLPHPLPYHPLRCGHFLKVKRNHLFFFPLVLIIINTFAFFLLKLGLYVYILNFSILNIFSIIIYPFETFLYGWIKFYHWVSLIYLTIFLL